MNPYSNSSSGHNNSQSTHFPSINNHKVRNSNGINENQNNGKNNYYNSNQFQPSVDARGTKHNQSHFSKYDNVNSFNNNHPLTSHPQAIASFDSDNKHNKQSQNRNYSDQSSSYQSNNASNYNDDINNHNTEIIDIEEETVPQGKISHKSNSGNKKTQYQPMHTRDKLMQLLVNITSSSFNISPSIADSLLNSRGQLLYSNNANNCTVSWLERLLTKSAKLTRKALESNSMFFLLDLIKPCFLSNSSEITQLASRLLTAISMNSNENQSSNMNSDAIWIWFTSPGPNNNNNNIDNTSNGAFIMQSNLSCLDLFLKNYSVNPIILAEPDVFEFFHHYVENHYFELFSLYLSSSPILNTPVQYISFILALIPHFAVHSTAWPNAINDGLLELIVDYSVQHSKSSIPSLITRMKALQLVTAIWINFHSNSEGKLVPFQSIVVELLRKTVQEHRREKQRKSYKLNEKQINTPKHQNELFQLVSSAYRCLFQLLGLLIQTKHSLAPIIYKTLICNTLELIADNNVNNNNDAKFNQQLLQFVLTEFSSLLDFHSELPVGVMIEPIVKQYSNYGFQCGPTDFNFLSILCLHPRLQVNKAMLLLHLLGKIVLSNQQISKLSNKPFLTLIDRFQVDSTILEYIEKYLKVALSIFMKATQAMHNNTNNNTAAVQIVDEKGNNNHLDPGLKDNNTAVIKHQLSIDIIAQIFYLNHAAINNILTPLLVFVYEDCMNLYGQVHSRLKALIPHINTNNYKAIANSYATQQHQTPQPIPTSATANVSNTGFSNKNEVQSQPPPSSTRDKNINVENTKSSKVTMIQDNNQEIKANRAVTSHIPVLKKPSSASSATQTQQSDQILKSNQSEHVETVMANNKTPISNGIVDPKLSVEDFVGMLKQQKNKAVKPQPTSPETNQLIQPPATRTNGVISPTGSIRSTLTGLTTLSAATSLHTITTAITNTSHYYAPSQIGALEQQNIDNISNNNNNSNTVTNPLILKKRATEALEEVKKKRDSKQAAKEAAEQAEKARAERLTEQAKRAAKLRRERVIQQSKQQQQEQTEDITTVNSIGTATPSFSSVPLVIIAPKKHARLDKEEPNLDYSYFPPRIQYVLTIAYTEIFTKLFKFYYGKTPNTVKMNSFDALNKHSKAMNFSDYCKFLQDFCVIPGLTMKIYIQNMFNQLCKGQQIIAEENEFDNNPTAKIKEVTEKTTPLNGLPFNLFLKSIWCLSRIADLTNTQNLGPRPRKQREEDEIRSLWVFIQYLQNASLQPDILPKQVKLNWPNLTAQDCLELEQKQRQLKVKKLCTGIIYDILAKAIGLDKSQQPSKPLTINPNPNAPMIYKVNRTPQAKLIPDINPVNTASAHTALSNELEAAKAEKERIRAAKLRIQVELYRQQLAERELAAQLERDRLTIEAEAEAKLQKMKQKKKRVQEAEKLSEYKKSKAEQQDLAFKQQVDKQKQEREERKKNVESYMQLKAEKKKLQQEEENKRIQQFNKQMQLLETKPVIDNNPSTDFVNTDAKYPIANPADNTNSQNAEKKARRKWKIEGEESNIVPSPNNTVIPAASISVIPRVMNSSNSSAILEHVEQAIASARKSTRKPIESSNQLDKETEIQSTLVSSEVKEDLIASEKKAKELIHDLSHQTAKVMVNRDDSDKNSEENSPHLSDEEEIDTN